MLSPMLITRAIEFKTCNGAIYRYVTYIMCTLFILLNVSGECDFSIWKCLRPAQGTKFYHFCTHFAAGFYVLLYKSGISGVHLSVCY